MRCCRAGSFALLLIFISELRESERISYADYPHPNPLPEERGLFEITVSVQVVLAQPEDPPQRADISKMIVHRSARKRDGAALPIAAAEARHI